LPTGVPRRKVLDLVEVGRSGADLARNLGIEQQSANVWRRQDRITPGLSSRLTSLNKAEPTAANRRITELPKGGSRRSR